MAMYGGLPVMLLLSIPITGALGIPLGRFWDAAIFTILLGIAFTKLGCYLNGCCTGRGIWRARFPAQLLEAAWAALLTILAAAAVSWRLPPYPGALFLMAGGMYASGRLVFENLRESEPGGTPRAGVVFSIALLVLSAAVHFVQQSR
jgi:prolipoprotein diacylglyceryltransferase